ncbi:MAG: M48 family metallopeptidase [Paramuribaculum sp.]|nr:M48 family metallopeptidase [Paramuribaculum sp.]
MNSVLKLITGVFICMSVSVVPAAAQFNLKKAVGGAAKAAQAVTLTDAQMAAYVKESVDWMDKHNPVLPDDDPYTIRLKKLVDGITEVDGMPLNFKVYNVIDVNAFACADGSVRVFSSLMDIMTDDELLGVIGHEIGHVAKHHSKKAFKTALLTDALKDGVSSTGGVAAALSDSQLGTLSNAVINSKFSQKQENEADEYGYEFLKANGKNPRAMAAAFQRFLTLEGDGAKRSYVDKMFSSHPETEARIKRVNERADKDGIPPLPVQEETKE